MPAFAQEAGLPERRLPQEHRDLAAVLEVRVSRSLATLPQGEMLVVEHHRAAAGRHLAKPSGSTATTRHTWAGKAVLMYSSSALGILATPLLRPPDPERRGRSVKRRGRAHDHGARQRRRGWGRRSLVVARTAALAKAPVSKWTKITERSTACPPREPDCDEQRELTMGGRKAVSLPSITARSASEASFGHPRLLRRSAPGDGRGEATRRTPCRSREERARPGRGCASRRRSGPWQSHQRRLPAPHLLPVTSGRRLAGSPRSTPPRGTTPGAGGGRRGAGAADTSPATLSSVPPRHRRRQGLGLVRKPHAIDQRLTLEPLVPALPRWRPGCPIARTPTWASFRRSRGDLPGRARGAGRRWARRTSSSTTSAGLPVRPLSIATAFVAKGFDPAGMLDRYIAFVNAALAGRPPGSRWASTSAVATTRASGSAKGRTISWPPRHSPAPASTFPPRDDPPRAEGSSRSARRPRPLGRPRPGIDQDARPRGPGRPAPSARRRGAARASTGWRSAPSAASRAPRPATR